MNIIQEIIATLLKAKYLEFFASGLSDREKYFIEAFMNSNLMKTYQLKKTKKGKLVFIWFSNTTNANVACYVTDQGIFFSKVRVYDMDNNDMTTSEPQDLIQREIDEIRLLFQEFIKISDVYFM